MARSPVHLTREPTRDFFARLQLDPPWIMLQKQFARLQLQLSQRRPTFSADAMSTDTDDVIALTPDYPQCQLLEPAPSADPCAQVGDLRCPECRRAFHQAGPLKRSVSPGASRPVHVDMSLHPLLG